LKNIYYLSILDSLSVVVRTGIFDGCSALFGPDNQDYQEGYNGTEYDDEIISSSTIINNYTENIAIVVLGFSNYTLIDLRITFNIYFFALEDFEFPELLNFTSVITYNSILRILDDGDDVNCEKEAVVNENKLKYKCAIDAKNSNIKNIAINKDINFDGNEVDLIISPLASEYINNLQSLPESYTNLLENANIFVLQKSKLNQNEKVFNISGIMEEDPKFEVNKNITLITNSSSQQDKKEINCRIVDTTLAKYTLNCRLNDNIKYDLNNSLSVVDDDILLVSFEDNSIITYDTNTSEYTNHRIFYKKSSGLSAGAIVAIILVPVIALALIISAFFFFKRKNNDKIMTDASASTIVLQN